MRANDSILDADMTTLLRTLREGLRWWLDELAALVPAKFRRRKELRNFIAYGGSGKWTRAGSGPPRAILVAPSLCLVRTITLPPLGQADLQRMVALDADRILPIPSTGLVIAAAADPANPTQVTVAGLPRSHAETMLAQMRSAGFPVKRVALGDDAHPGRALADFGPSLRAAGLLHARRQLARKWWALAGFLFVLNAGLLVWRDRQQLAHLESLVAQQAPAVATARTISQRIADRRGRSLQLHEKRERQDGMAILAAVTTALPQDAWGHRFSWSGKDIRLSGFKKQGTDVTGAIRRSPSFARVRAASTEGSSELPGSQPFDLSMQIRAVQP